MNNKGGVVGITVLALLSVFFLLMFYIILQFYNPITDLIFPELANLPNGSVIQLVIEFLPLILILLFVVVVITVGTKSRASDYAG